MAQTGYTPISIYYSSTATNVPTAGNLVAGELAINTADGKLFYKDSAGVVQVIAGKGGAGVAGGSNTQVQYNSSGSLAGSANFVFDGTSVGIGTSSPSNLLHVSQASSDFQVRVTGTSAGNAASLRAYNDGGQAFGIGMSGSTNSGYGANLGFIGTITNNSQIFLTNNTEQMRINTNGYIGIGTASPIAALTVGKANTYAGGLVLGVAAVASGYLSTTDNLYIKPNTSANTASGYVNIQNVSGTTYISMYSGSGSIAVGGATAVTTGAGITFPATQSASSDANTLDDYEEGTWTPSIGGTAVYTAQDGRYTKIGNFVKLRFLLAVSVKGTGSATTITGMPFAPSAASPTITGGVVCYAAGLAVSANILGIYCQNSGNIYFFTRDGAGTGATTQQPAVIGNSFTAYCEVSYMVD
jgi:hypothetical protein